MQNLEILPLTLGVFMFDILLVIGITIFVLLLFYKVARGVGWLSSRINMKDTSIFQSEDETYHTDSEKYWTSRRRLSDLELSQETFVRLIFFAHIWGIVGVLMLINFILELGFGLWFGTLLAKYIEY